MLTAGVLKLTAGVLFVVEKPAIAISRQSHVSTFFLIIAVLFFCFTYGYSIVGLIVYRSKDMK
ncbi:hypothetical protein HMPREF9151_01791 [Hoylesella saccharolytica F0055]|uniref:Uncharacterized protein n=1 Tax=Hoylesella saccharolytica F0055 TaxID=1127699 RepID=L1N6S6_9BACT|nr:hypothetical protein HMPREF9151_01791 [Hoylesella saccharolytica F0055]